MKLILFEKKTNLRLLVQISFDRKMVASFRFGPHGAGIAMPVTHLLVE